MLWKRGGLGRDTSCCSWRNIFPQNLGESYTDPKWNYLLLQLSHFITQFTHMHLPGSTLGLCDWQVTADSLKTGSFEEWLSATLRFSHFNIVMSLKPKRVWLMLSRKCSCCGYTTRNCTGVSLDCAVPAPISPLSVCSWHCRFQKRLPERYKVSSYIKHTTLLLFLNFKETDTDYFGVYRKYIYFNVCTVNF